MVRAVIFILVSLQVTFGQIDKPQPQFNLIVEFDKLKEIFPNQPEQIDRVIGQLSTEIKNFKKQESLGG